jgi:membrane-bound metal-dependent hydrolase YbcI (DUF457 family)
VAAVAPLRRAAVLGAVAGGCLIDADHLPYTLFRSEALTEGTVRPYSHSALTVAVLAVALAAARRRRAAIVLASALIALASHLGRDAATGGVPLAWPASEDNVTLPYEAYAAALVVAGAAVAVRARRARSSAAG